MTNFTRDSCGHIIKAFLLSPLNRKAFDSFFGICYQSTVGYLRYLKAKGFQLPHELKAEGNPFGDLAIDLLGTFLHSNRDRPFPVIFGYFNKLGYAQPREADPDDLLHCFTVLLRGHIRQQLARLKVQQAPQVDHLKRRFKEILKDVRFKILPKSSGEEWISLAQHCDDRREGRPPLLYNDLLQIVEKAYLNSRSRTDWCLDIFKLVNEATQYQNLVKKHELLTAIVSVNSKYVEADGLQPVCLPTPKEALLTKTIEEAIAETLSWLKESVLDRFIHNVRIDSEEAERFQQAAEKYLSDLAHTGQTDSLPEYFREVMPEGKRITYLSDYKYVFETTINQAVENFKDRLKKKSTVLKYRDYF